eukprot:14608495-Alexandrium_andersonii.AAC.1
MPLTLVEQQLPVVLESRLDASLLHLSDWFAWSQDRPLELAGICTLSPLSLALSLRHPSLD